MAKGNILLREKNSYIPVWVDPEKYFALDLAARWNATQAVLLILGDEGRGGAMAQLRGLSSEPPAFIKTEIWQRPSNTRIDEARAMEEHAARDYGLQMKAEKDRQKANEKCEHTYGAPIATNEKTSRACTKCGHVTYDFTIPC